MLQCIIQMCQKQNDALFTTSSAADSEMWQQADPNIHDLRLWAIQAAVVTFKLFLLANRESHSFFLSTTKVGISPGLVFLQLLWTSECRTVPNQAHHHHRHILYAPVK